MPVVVDTHEMFDRAKGLVEHHGAFMGAPIDQRSDAADVVAHDDDRGVTDVHQTVVAAYILRSMFQIVIVI